MGNDYYTEDCTCVCDYVHVVDLVEAHILVREHPESGNKRNIFDLESSQGFSVKQIIDCARKVTNI